MNFGVLFRFAVGGVLSKILRFLGKYAPSLPSGGRGDSQYSTVGWKIALAKSLPERL